MGYCCWISVRAVGDLEEKVWRFKGEEQRMFGNVFKRRQDSRYRWAVRIFFLECLLQRGDSSERERNGRVEERTVAAPMGSSRWQLWAGHSLGELSGKSKKSQRGSLDTERILGGGGGTCL